MKLFELSKIKEKISNKIREFNKDILGKSPLTFYFSFQSFFNRSQYFGALIILGSFLTFICSFDFLPLTVLSGLVVFYAGLAVTQKRCRDINMKGSFFYHNIYNSLSLRSFRNQLFIKQRIHEFFFFLFIYKNTRSRRQSNYYASQTNSFHFSISVYFLHSGYSL